MKKENKFFQKGITLIELIITMMVLSIIFGLVSVNLLNTRQRTNFNASLNQLLSDIKLQQTKAMSLSVENNAPTTSDYGIHFETETYTLFRGSTYTIGASDNFIIPLGDNMQFSSSTFPGSTIVFSKLSGEILSFNPALNSIVLKNTLNNQQKTIRLNRYGVFTQIE